MRGTAAEPGHAARRRNTAKTTAYLRHHGCPSYHFALVSFDTVGRFSSGAMQFLGTAADGASLAPLKAALAAAALTICTNGPHLTVVGTTPACLLLLRVFRRPTLD